MVNKILFTNTDFFQCVASESLPYLTLEPSRSYLKPGDSIEVDCVSSESHYAHVVWEREHGQRLPQNFQVRITIFMMIDVLLQCVIV